MWNLWNVWYLQIRFWFWSRSRSLWAGASAKTWTFTLWTLLLPCEHWLSGFWASIVSHLEGIRPVDLVFSVDFTLLGAPLVATFFGGGFCWNKGVSQVTYWVLTITRYQNNQLDMLNNLFKCAGSIIKVLFLEILIEQVHEQRNLFEA